MALADVLEFEEWQRDALHFSALWHDIGRTHDGVDYYHGAKSAGRVVGLRLHEGLDDDVRETALFAVTHHSGSEEHANRAVGWLRAGGHDVFRALKDADALDRVRLGSGLDPSFLRFSESHERIEDAWVLLDQTEKPVRRTLAPTPEAQRRLARHGFGLGPSGQ
jgi:hypothetical protein